MLRRYLPRLLTAIPADRAVRILDLGTGSADLPRAMVAWGRDRGRELRVIGVDNNPEVMECARRECAEEPAVRLVQADIFHLPFPPGSFDLVICSLFLHHFEPPEAVRLLRGDGGPGEARPARQRPSAASAGVLGDLDPVPHDAQGRAVPARCAAVGAARPIASRSCVLSSGRPVSAGWRWTVCSPSASPPTGAPTGERSERDRGAGDRGRPGGSGGGGGAGRPGPAGAGRRSGPGPPGPGLRRVREQRVFAAGCGSWAPWTSSLSLDLPELRRARFTSPDGQILEFPLPGQHPASLGIRRRELDEALLQAARRAGAEVLRPARFRDILRDDAGTVRGAAVETPDRRLSIRSRLLVGADGRASRVARRLGVGSPLPIDSPLRHQGPRRARSGLRGSGRSRGDPSVPRWLCRDAAGGRRAG